MKYLLALVAALAFAAPAFAQEAEKPRTVKVTATGGVTIIEEESTEECEEIEEGELPEEIREKLKEIEDLLPDEIREALRRAREGKEEAEEGVDEAQLPEEIREMLERLREKLENMREELEKKMEELENDPDAEVEEYEETSPDGSSTVKIKIVRIRKIIKEGEAPEAPEVPGTPRKQ